tara:strand:+ start:687 stop:1022 length:336 start_codon:yes stop_codon:yes gene_type:complete
MVDLNNISEEARGLLVEAAGFEHIPYTERIYNKDYQELYQKFQKATHQQFLHQEGDEIGKSFDRFQVAAVRMKRKLKTLTYKDGSGLSYDTKDTSDFYPEIKNKVWRELGI